MPVARSKGPRYTPVAKRQDRPDAIAWLLKVHPELQDSQVAKLVGSTKSTVQSVEDRSHWNMQNVRPRDPVTLGLCSLKDLNDAVDSARRKAAREDAAKKKAKLAAGEPVVEEAGAGRSGRGRPARRHRVAVTTATSRCLTAT